jgi:hypothetical protein
MAHLIGRHEIYGCDLPPFGAALPVDRVDAARSAGASRASGKRSKMTAKGWFNLLLWGLFGGMFAAFAAGWSILAFAFMGVFMLVVFVARMGG